MFDHRIVPLLSIITTFIIIPSFTGCSFNHGHYHADGVVYGNALDAMCKAKGFDTHEGGNVHTDRYCDKSFIHKGYHYGNGGYSGDTCFGSITTKTETDYYCNYYWETAVLYLCVLPSFGLCYLPWLLTPS